VDAGGKRIRPLLCLLAARLGGVTSPPAIRVATASELIHTASLLHDDVVDETPLRRNRPAAPRVFGNSACVLVGDALLARSLSLLAELESRAPLSSLARCVRQMAVGEIQQLVQTGQPDASLLGYIRIIEGKTSALFAWCSTCGDLCREPLLSPLRRFGRRLGMAFQISDDILDYAGDPICTGKSIGSDLAEGKMTLPLYYALRCQPPLLSMVKDLRSSSMTSEGITELVEAVQKSGGIEHATLAADTLLSRAHRALDELPPSRWRDHLHTLADYVVQRVN